MIFFLSLNNKFRHNEFHVTDPYKEQYKSITKQVPKTAV